MNLHGFVSGRLPRSFFWLGLGLAAVVVGGLVAVLWWPSALPMELSAGVPELTVLVTEASEEVYSVPVTLSTPGKWPQPNSVIFFERDSTRAEAKVASGEWVEAHCSFPAERISAGWKGEGSVLAPQGTEAIRLRLRCAGLSWRWRMAGVLSRWWEPFPATVVRWLGPRMGRKPRWREVVVEVAVSKELHREHRGRGTESTEILL